MDLTAIQPRASAANVPLDELANNRALTQQQKVAEVAQQFEAVMLQQILQESQKPVFKTEFTDNSTAADIYRSLLSKQFSEAISKSGEFGLARMLEKQLSHQLKPESSSTQTQSANPTAIPQVNSGVAPAVVKTKELSQFTAPLSK